MLARAYSSSVRDYDYPAIVTGCHIRLEEALPPVPAPRAPNYPIPIPSPPMEGLESNRGRMGAPSKACVVLLVALIGVTIGTASFVLHFVMNTPSDPVTSCECPSKNRFESKVQSLEEKDKELQISGATEQPAKSLPLPVTTPTALPVTTPIALPVTTSTFPFAERDRNMTLSIPNLFQDCTTSIEASCEISPGEPASGNDFKSCVTDPPHVINRPGEYVLNVQCLIVQETVESNPLIATLDIDHNLGFCRCFVPTLNSVNQVTHFVTCGMQITRCIIPTHITGLFT